MSRPRARSRLAIAALTAALALVALSTGQAVSAATDTEAPLLLLSPGAWQGTTVPMYVPTGEAFDLKYQVKDDSGQARVTFWLYSGGTLVRTVGGEQFGTADGNSRLLRMDPVAPTTIDTFGPFYACGVAVDAAGNASSSDPKSLCAWLALEVPMKAPLTNGCGKQTDARWIDRLQQRQLDTRSFDGVKVRFRPACDAHDAGYWGVTVRDQVTGNVNNYRTLSREWVDKQFYWDLVTQCRKYARPHLQTMTERAYKLCDPGVSLKRYLSGIGFGALHLDTYVQPGAHVYYEAVRKWAKKAYDTDSTVPGTQTVIPSTTVPGGGARNNA